MLNIVRNDLRKEDIEQVIITRAQKMVKEVVFDLSPEVFNIHGGMKAGEKRRR